MSNHALCRTRRGSSRELQKLDFNGLKSWLSTFQAELKTVNLTQEQMCSGSVNHLLEEFTDALDKVSESDELLIRQSRQVGTSYDALLGESTSLAIFMTQRLTHEVTETVKSFEKELSNAQALDEEIAYFAISQVARCRHDFELVIENHETETARMGNEINTANLRLTQTRDTIEKLKGSITDAEKRAKQHKTARNVGIGVGVTSGVAALGTVGLAILFPPAGIAAGIGAAAGWVGGVTGSVVGGVVAGVQDDNVDTQVARQLDFQQQADKQATELRDLEAAKTRTERELVQSTSTLKSIQKLSDELVPIQLGFQSIRSELMSTQTVFTLLQLRLNDMAMDLEMCEFVETREELAKGLNDALDSLVAQSKIGVQDARVMKLRELIAGIVSRTADILRALR